MIIFDESSLVIKIRLEKPSQSISNTFQWRAIEVILHPRQSVPNVCEGQVVHNKFKPTGEVCQPEIVPGNFRCQSNFPMRFKFGRPV